MFHHSTFIIIKNRGKFLNSRGVSMNIHSSIFLQKEYYSVIDQIINETLDRVHAISSFDKMSLITKRKFLSTSEIKSLNMKLLKQKKIFYSFFRMKTFKLMSYNILANSLITEDQAKQYMPFEEKYLGVEYRSALILKFSSFFISFKKLWIGKSKMLDLIFFVYKWF